VEAVDTCAVHRRAAHARARERPLRAPANPRCRREKATEERKAKSGASKVYTNADLKPVADAPPAFVDAEPAADAPPSPPMTEAVRESILNRRKYAMDWSNWDR